mmetsp:Transcript_110620/g.323681  ORF Transcript_110620/g.323681 Transcript_110620/m.323681 type:complete len:291 (+) Transcript_110620:52-924(+)
MRQHLSPSMSVFVGATIFLATTVSSFRLQLPGGGDALPDAMRHIMKRFTGTEQGSLNDLADQLARSAGKCDLCNGRNWVFIVGTGRSGSTTMVNMLNAIPGFHIAGENYHVVHELMAVYGKAKRNRWPASGGPAQHRPVSELNVLCALQLITEELIGATSLATSRAVGFKEIRWSKDELDFMLQAFPCAHFIVTTRIDVEAQSHSGFWPDKPDALTIIKEQKALLEQWQSNHIDRTTWLPLEKFSVAEFNHMLQWLNVTGCKFASVCHSNHHGSYTPDPQHAIIKGSCSA